LIDYCFNHSKQFGSSLLFQELQLVGFVADLVHHSLGQQRQTLMFPLVLLRATRLQTTLSEFWPGLIGLMTVVHSEAWAAAPAISMPRAPSRVASVFTGQHPGIRKP